MPTSPTVATAPADDHMDGHAWALLIVLSGAIFLEGADLSLVGVALPSIRAELGMSTSGLQWVVSAYVLGYGGFVLLGGRIGDLAGRRRLFLLSLTAFVLFSGLGGLAQDGWVLIASRFATGLTAAFMTPVGLSIITTTFAEGPARNRAVLIYGAFGAAGFSLGLVLGGLLTGLDWRWVFFAPVVLAAMLLAVAHRVIPRDRPVTIGGAMDVRGAVLLTTGMLLAVFTVVESPVAPALQSTVTGTASIVALVAFIRTERRASAPLVRLGLLRQGPVVRANLGALLWAASFVAFQFLAVLYLQQVRGWSPVATGLALLPVAIDAVLAPTITPWLIARFGLVRTIASGLALGLVGYALFLPIGVDSSYALAMLPTMLLIGLAFTLVYGPLTIAATDGVADDEQGLASGLFNTSFQFGAALGLAAAAAVVVTASASDSSPEALLSAYRAGLLVPVVAAALALAVTLSAARARR